MNYFDSSTLVKRYVAEAGSPAVQRLIGAAGIVLTTALSFPEILSGLSRAKRDGRLDDADYRMSKDRFLREWADFNASGLAAPILGRCRDIIERYPLSGADAVHLATALEFQASVSKDLVFVSSDQRLLDAARKSGLRTLDPEEG